MATNTPNYNFILPGVNDPTDQDLWGGYLNENWSDLDTILVSIAPAAVVPIGAGMDYWGSSAPAAWIFAYGQAISRTTYADLFAVYGTTYGPGDGSTTFNVPDKRGRTSFGKDNMGGTSADRLTGLTNGIDGDTLGAVGGEEAHTLTTAQVPALSLSIPARTENTGGNDNTRVQLGTTSGTPLTFTGGTATGGGGAHNTLPPGIVCNYIIYTGV